MGKVRKMEKRVGKSEMREKKIEGKNARAIDKITVLLAARRSTRG